MSLHCMLIPVQYREYQYGLLFKSLSLFIYLEKETFLLKKINE